MINTIAKLCVAATALVFAGTNPALSADELSAGDKAKLQSILAEQPDNVKARYQYRHPLETLEFLGVKPGMTVADTLPGSYYSNILLPYLGDSGKLVGVSYSLDHRALDYADNEERMARYRAFPETFPKNAAEWRGEGKTEVGAFLFGAMPEGVKGTVDVFLLFRAMHHLNKYEDRIGTRTDAFKDIFDALKPGGVVGIVQHRAPAGNSDEWAKGFNGYIKQQPLIDNMVAAGFEFVGSSEVNANAKDVPTESDYVWRLPPVLSGSDDDAEKRARLEAIGESDRMTLKFRKP